MFSRVPWGLSAVVLTRCKQHSVCFTLFSVAPTMQYLLLGGTWHRLLGASGFKGNGAGVV